MKEEEVTVTIPSIFGYEEVATETVGTVARMKSWPFEKITKLQTAVAEACVNAIEHGNQADASKTVEMKIRCGQASMQVSVKDSGAGHANPDFRMPDLKQQVQEKKLGGWGMYLIHALVDEVRVAAVPNEGTTTVMTVHREDDA